LVKEGPELESITTEDPEAKSESIMVSGDERSTETSSPVIRVYGSTGVEARALETTEIGDRINPYGAWVTGRKSEAKGVKKEAPVSNTTGGVGAETKFGWNVTESEGVAATTVAVATEVVGVAEATV